jgi:transcriptional regulator with XRE-family HTH domain
VKSNQVREAFCSEVARILQDERKQKGISMTRLAERAGLSQSMISLIERNLRNPTLDTLLRITEALDIELSDVLDAAKTACASRSR